MFPTFKSNKSAIFWQVTELSILSQLPDWLDILRPTVGVAKIPCRNHMILFFCDVINISPSSLSEISAGRPFDIQAGQAVRTFFVQFLTSLGQQVQTGSHFDNFLQSLLSKSCHCWFTAAILLTPIIGRKLSGKFGNCADNCSSETCQKMALLSQVKLTSSLWRQISKLQIS